jgi:hypothetical protein
MTYDLQSTSSDESSGPQSGTSSQTKLLGMHRPDTLHTNSFSRHVVSKNKHSYSTVQYNTVFAYAAVDH